MTNCEENEPYALMVLGDSMAPEFIEGHVIIIEPGGEVKNDSYVFAIYEEEYIFRQLHIENRQYFLKPLNDKYPTLEVSSLDAIKGLITQRSGRRRKDKKYYV